VPAARRVRRKGEGSVSRKPKTNRKLKTNKSAAKRFKVTGTGKITRGHSHHRHILTKKSRKRVRMLSDSDLVSKPDTARVKKMLNL
jgi:large subunit ribosomal protein L35